MDEMIMLCRKWVLSCHMQTKLSPTITVTSQISARGRLNSSGILWGVGAKSRTCLGISCKRPPSQMLRCHLSDSSTNFGHLLPENAARSSQLTPMWTWVLATTLTALVGGASSRTPFFRRVAKTGVWTHTISRRVLQCSRDYGYFFFVLLLYSQLKFCSLSQVLAYVLTGSAVVSGVLAFYTWKKHGNKCGNSKCGNSKPLCGDWTSTDCTLSSCSSRI